MQVGVAEVNITPELGLPLAGMVNPPKARGVQWPLTGRVLVFDDGERRAAVVCLDLLSLEGRTVAEYRAAMAAEAAAAGVALEPGAIMIACSHTHRAPYTKAGITEDADYAYLALVRERLVEGTRAALAARRPARLRVAHTDAPGWSFNRRPVYATEMGEQVGTNGPRWVPEFLRAEGPVDSSLAVLAAEDDQGRIIAGLVNYASHCTVMASEAVYSADYPGPLAEILSARHGGVWGFLQGAAGNLTPVDMSRPETVRGRGEAFAREMAAALAEAASGALVGARVIEGGRVRYASEVLRIPQRQPTAEQVELAQWYLEQAKPGVDERAYNRRIQGCEYIFYNRSAAVTTWHCREIIGQWEWLRRVGTPELVDDVEVMALAIGGSRPDDALALVGFPCEYFTEFGLRIRAESPFPETVVAELANGWHGYVPTREAFARGGYETRLRHGSRLAPDAGDRMCDAGLRLLRSL